MNDPADRSVQGSQEESEQPPFAASASLYRLPRSLIIVTVDRTTVGFSVETDRVMGLPADTDPQALGGVLLVSPNPDTQGGQPRKTLPISAGTQGPR